MATQNKICSGRATGAGTRTTRNREVVCHPFIFYPDFGALASQGVRYE